MGPIRNKLRQAFGRSLGRSVADLFWLRLMRQDSVVQWLSSHHLFHLKSHTLNYLSINLSFATPFRAVPWLCDCLIFQLERIALVAVWRRQRLCGGRTGGRLFRFLFSFLFYDWFTPTWGNESVREKREEKRKEERETNGAAAAERSATLEVYSSVTCID